jgi:RNA polymerase sigma-70 factor (sigma-E family)
VDSEADRRFQEFVAGRSVALRRLAFLLCSDWHLAEDLVQSALTRAYGAWRRVERSDDVDAYVRRILVNLATDRWHKRRRLGEHVGAAGDRPASGDAMAEIDQRDELVRFLDQLPAKQRAVLVLRFFEDLSTEATADLLGISTGTVKSHTSRGLTKLRELTEAVERNGAAT